MPEQVFRGSRRWALLLLVPLALGAAFDAWLSALNEDAPSGLLRPLPDFVPAAAAAPARVARRLVLVIVDGLRLDESRNLPFLNEIRRRGVDAEARAELPTHSRPNYFVLLTGTDPARHGVRNNRFTKPAVADTLLARVRARGERVAAASDLNWWAQNFGKNFDSWHLAERPTLEAVETAFGTALGQAARLTLLHVVALDAAAHRDGIQAEYHTTARAIDALLARVCGGLDLTQDLLVITADHGHRARGGHGGIEPEVARVPLLLAGPGLTPSQDVLSLGSLGGLAPTLAVLSGVAFPADASFPIYERVLDVRSLGEGYVNARRDAYGALRRRYEEAWLRRAGVLPDPSGELSALLAQRAELNRTRTTRRLLLPRLLAAGSLGALVWFTRGLGVKRRSWFGVPVFGLVLLALVLVFAGTLSASAVARLSSHLVLLTLAASAGFLLHCAGLRWLIGPRPANGAWQRVLLRDAVIYASLPLFFWLWSGFGYRERLPEAACLYLPLLLTFGGAFFAAVVAVWFGLGRVRAGYKESRTQLSL